MSHARRAPPRPANRSLRKNGKQGVRSRAECSNNRDNTTLPQTAIHCRIVPTSLPSVNYKGGLSVGLALVWAQAQLGPRKTPDSRPFARREEHDADAEPMVRGRTGSGHHLCGVCGRRPESPLSPSPLTAGAAAATAETDADAIDSPALPGATQPASNHDDLLTGLNDGGMRSADSWTPGTPLPPRNVRFTPTTTNVLDRWTVGVQWDDPVGGPSISGNPDDRVFVATCPVGTNIHRQGFNRCNTFAVNTSAKSFDILAYKGEWEGWLRLENSTGAGSWGGSQIFAVGQSRFKPDQPQNLRAQVTNVSGPPFDLINGRSFKTRMVRVRWNEPDGLDFVENPIRVDHWISYAKRVTRRNTAAEFLTDSDGPYVDLPLPEGRAVFSVRLRNNKGLGQSRGTSTTVRPQGISAPGAPTSVTLTGQGSNRKFTWQAPDDFGGGPLHRYEYSYNSDCVEPRRPWPLRGEERFIPQAQYEVNTRSDVMSVRAVNSKGVGDCVTVRER